MNTIPLIGQFDGNEEANWLSALSSQESRFTFKPLHALTDQEKDAAEVAVIANPDPALLDQLPNLKWVQSLWAGVERVIPVAKARDLKLVRLVDPVLAETMAEAVLTACLMSHRHVFHYARSQRNRQWQPMRQPRAGDRTIGLLGLGELGQASAARLVEAGFKVTGWSRLPKTVKNVQCVSGETGFNSVLEQSDCLVCLLPSTPQTTGLLGETQFNAMKPTATLINFGRGSLIQEPALLSWLNQNPESQALLDVFDAEPLPQEHPFWLHPQISVWPHVSAPTNMESASAIVIANIEAYVENGRMPETVNLNSGY